MKKTNKVALLLFLVASTMPAKTLARNDVDSFVEGACLVGGALIGLAGAATLVNWCCSETDDQMIVRINAEYNNALQYSGMIDSYYYDLSLEPLLYSLAYQIWNMNQSQSSYRSSVRSAKKQLESARASLQKRLNNLKTKRNLHYEQQERARRMHLLIRKIEDFLPRLTSFSDFMDYHKGYFTLYETEGKLSACYNKELSIVDSAQEGAWNNSSAYIVDTLKHSIVYSSSNSRYPYVHFVNRLESDISLLESHIRSLVYNYSNRIGAAHYLVNSLSRIKGFIVADFAYAQELYAMNQERLERERIAILEAQLRAQQAQARAQQDIADAMYQNARLQRQQQQNNLSGDFSVTVRLN